MNVKSKLPVGLITWICVILIGATTLAYVCHFGGKSFWTSKPEHWGQFGDFIGGFLGTVLGILNLIVLVYLTQYVANQDNTTTLNQFRFEFYLKQKEAMDFFDSESFDVKDHDRLKQAVKGIKDYSFLFYGQALKEEYLIIANVMEEATSRLNPWYLYGSNSNEDDERWREEYENAKSRLFQFIQKSMLQSS